MKKKYQIFISSTYEDLKEERRKVQDAILSMYHFPIGMEMFSAADKEQWEIIKETIDSSDYYVLIIANRYGTVIEKGPDKDISFTEKEYNYAKKQGIPILAFIIDDSVQRLRTQYETKSKSQKKLTKFINEVKSSRIVERWKNADELAARVMNALNKEINNSTRPGWVRTTDCLSGDELEKAKNEIQELKKINEHLMYRPYDLPSMFIEAFDLRDMQCYVSQGNKIYENITLENEFKRNANGHIIYFNNQDQKTNKLKDEFIMLAYIYQVKQNWIKYYYNNYGLFFSIRGSQNIRQVQLEIKEWNTNLICVYHQEFDVAENRKDFFIKIRDIDIRHLSNIKEICFTIYNNYFDENGKCEFEVCDMWLKSLSFDI